MRGGVFLLLAAVVGAAACVSAPPPDLPRSPLAEAELEGFETEVERAFFRGLVAVKLGDYATARREIGRVAESCSGEAAGARALLTLASLELDPRNSAADPVAARALVEHYFSLPRRPAWTEPAAQTLYLLSVDMGGAIPVVETPDEEAGANGEAPVASPERRSGRPVAITSAGEPPFHPDDCASAREELVRGSLQTPMLPELPLATRMEILESERDSLQATVNRLERQVQEFRHELERIRETLRP